ncbi:MAG TPA: ImmA/IrrE family metallo-endopeptidase [Phycisphaerae bacterium]|nr:ImmA/IrrE family metallo-endopeptidase [Phycisphaerae bacterium]HUU82579.1 ImmA/IrrE family metallo-endopeptidase [Phycisphaerae bacterium]
MALPEPPTYSAGELERRARDFLSKRYGDAISIPVDVDLLLEQLEGVVLDIWPGLRTNHGVEGMVLRDPETGDLLVYIDEWLADNVPARYRMTVAEELGHLILHRKVIDAVHTIDDFREFQRHYRNVEMERNAKRFAAAILMPADAVLSEAARLYRLFVRAAGFGDPGAIKRQLARQLAKRFQVSSQSMEYRLTEWPMRVFERVDQAMKDQLDFLE